MADDLVSPLGVEYWHAAYETQRGLTAAAEAERDRLREALERTSSMLESVTAQLRSWGHDPWVNVAGQLEQNAALGTP